MDVGFSKSKDVYLATICTCLGVLQLHNWYEKSKNCKAYVVQLS
jgi:hypothetical protein